MIKQDFSHIYKQEPPQERIRSGVVIHLDILSANGAEAVETAKMLETHLNRFDDIENAVAELEVLL